jgi:hypothetical protein
MNVQTCRKQGKKMERKVCISLTHAEIDDVWYYLRKQKLQTKHKETIKELENLMVHFQETRY